MPGFVLVNPPNHEHDLDYLAPPLGLLALAQIGEECGWKHEIIDFCLPQFRDQVAETSTFYRFAAKKILECEPELVGFTSMGVNSHVSLLIAEMIKKEDRNICVVLGGPHFSAIHEAIQEFFPYVDVVVSGEGEQSFRQLLTELMRIGSSGRASKKICRVLRASSGNTRVSHPHRAYASCSLEPYFEANGRHVLSYEGGRGCIFKCSFCYSPEFYGSVLDLSPDTVVRDWSMLADLGARHVFMVQDNFTNNPRHATKVCESLAAADLPITWNGYATLPQLSGDLIEALGRSHCKQIYLGVDAVSPSQQDIFAKHFYRSLEGLLGHLKQLLNVGVEPTCAFILDLFNYSSEDAEAVFRTALACAEVGASVRINVLTRYPGTGLFSHAGRKKSIYSESKVRMLLDTPELVCCNPIARDRPWLFPFHATEVDEQTWLTRILTVRVASLYLRGYTSDLAFLARDTDGRLGAAFEELGMRLSSLSIDEIRRQDQAVLAEVF